MKKNIVPIVVVVFLFTCAAIVSFVSKGNASNASPETPAAAEAHDATVKICPHSGLPCEGEGDCEDECEESAE